jgi:hypothetical protein
LSKTTIIDQPLSKIMIQYAQGFPSECFFAPLFKKFQYFFALRASFYRSAPIIILEDTKMTEYSFPGTAKGLYNVSNLLNRGASIAKVDGEVLVTGPNGKENLLDFSDPQFAQEAQQARAVLGIIPNEITLTI